MKHNMMFFSFLITTFLFSNLGSVINVETAAAGPVVACDVKWNNKRNQVKDKHRRRYIACLLTEISSRLEPQREEQCKRRTLGCAKIKVQEATGGCIEGGWDISKPDLAYQRGLFQIDIVKNKNRRATIACLENRLQSLPATRGLQ